MERTEAPLERRAMWVQESFGLTTALGFETSGVVWPALGQRRLGLPGAHGHPVAAGSRLRRKASVKRGSDVMRMCRAYGAASGESQNAGLGFSSSPVCAAALGTLRLPSRSRLSGLIWRHILSGGKGLGRLGPGGLGLSASLRVSVEALGLGSLGPH